MHGGLFQQLEVVLGLYVGGGGGNLAHNSAMEGIC